MKTMTVGELKAQFSEVLGMIAENGEPIAISYGKKRERVAAIVPFRLLKSQGSRPLGLMQGHANFVFSDDSGLCDEDFLRS